MGSFFPQHPRWAHEPQIPTPGDSCFRSVLDTPAELRVQEVDFASATWAAAAPPDGGTWAAAQVAGLLT